MAAPRPWTRQDAQFILLRASAVLRFLAATEHSEHHIFVIRAGSIATRLALQTGFPMLVFPELFQELAESALRQACRQQFLRGRDLNPALEARWLCDTPAIAP